MPWSLLQQVPVCSGQDISAPFLSQRLFQTFQSAQEGGWGWGIAEPWGKGLVWGPWELCVCGCCRAPSGMLPTWRSCRAQGEYCSSQAPNPPLCACNSPRALERTFVGSGGDLGPILSHGVISHQQLCGEISPTSLLSPAQSENNKNLSFVRSIRISIPQCSQCCAGVNSCRLQWSKGCSTKEKPPFRWSRAACG